MADTTTFGIFIRGQRSQAKLSLREAATRLGMSASYLSRLEGDDYPPPKGDKLRRIADIYGCDINDLMRLAKGRAHEVMAADTETAPAVHAFYRLAQNQPPETLEAMIQGVVDAVDLPADQKRQIMDNLKAALSRHQGKDMPRLAKGRDGLFAYDIKPRFLSRDSIEAIASRVLKVSLEGRASLPVPIEEIVDQLGPEVSLIIDAEIPGGRLRDGSPAVLGLSRWSRDGKRRELVIHEDLFEGTTAAARRRKNFTMAHELFHCLEHLSLVIDRNADGAMSRLAGFATFSPNLTSSPWYERKRFHKQPSTNEDWREWQANAFAGALLMPADEVRGAFKSFAGTDCVTVPEGRRVDELADEMARSSYTDESGCATSLIDRFDVNPQAMAIRLKSLGLLVA